MYTNKNNNIMKKTEMQQWVCPECGSNRVQQKAWVDLNDNAIDWNSSSDLDEFYCMDCERLPKRLETKVIKCYNGRPRIEGYQVVGMKGTEAEGEINPQMDGSFCLYSLEQAKEMLMNDVNYPVWELLTCYKGDVEEPTIMFEGNPWE